MVNGWLLYQTSRCRHVGRARRSTSRAARSASATSCRTRRRSSTLGPTLTRAQILLHAAHQFVEGDVLHWWHPPLDRGTRTRFSDDLLGCRTSRRSTSRRPATRACSTSGAVRRRRAALEPGEDEAYLRADAAGERADVYEHCCRALDRSLDARRARPAAHGHGRLERRHEPRRARGARRERLARRSSSTTCSARFVPLCERARRRARAPRATRATATRPAAARRATRAGTATGTGARTTTTARRSARRRATSAGSTRSRRRGR